MCIDYGRNDGMEDDDLNELFENGFCNNEEGHAVCEEILEECRECFCSTDHFIMTPNHPGKYPNNADVTWLLMFLPGQRIKIDVETFDLEAHYHNDDHYKESHLSCTDYLAIYDGEYHEDYKLGKYCQKSTPSSTM